MNERLKELLEEATEVCDDWKTGGSQRLVDHKMFAELIVQECCQYLKNEAERLYSLSASERDPVFQSNFELCAEKCYDNIQGLKEHFGVKE